MRTVKVRILPPQPIFPHKIACEIGVGEFDTDPNTRKFQMLPRGGISSKGDFIAAKHKSDLQDRESSSLRSRCEEWTWLGTEDRQAVGPALEPET
jgi:hypothetical protein